MAVYFAAPLSVTITGVPASPGVTTFVHSVVAIVLAVTLLSCVHPAGGRGRAAEVVPAQREHQPVAHLRARRDRTVGLLLFAAEAFDPTNAIGLSTTTSCTVTGLTIVAVTPVLSVTVSRTL